MEKVKSMGFEELRRGVKQMRAEKVVVTESGGVVWYLSFRQRRALDAFKQYKGIVDDGEAVGWLLDKALRSYL